MLSSILNVYQEFFKLFKDVVVCDGDTEIRFPAHYYKDSKDNITQSTIESYPQISIIDYALKINPEWGKTYQKRYDGYHKKLSTDSVVNAAFEIEEPVLIDFTFDVNAFCKNAHHKWLIVEWFLKNFTCDAGMVFNKIEINSEQEDTTIGDYVDYKMSMSEPYRTDGIFEISFNFVITAMIQITEPKEVDLVRELTINTIPLFNN